MADHKPVKSPFVPTNVKTNPTDEVQLDLIHTMQTLIARSYSYHYAQGMILLLQSVFLPGSPQCLLSRPTLG